MSKQNRSTKINEYKAACKQHKLDKFATLVGDAERLAVVIDATPVPIDGRLVGTDLERLKRQLGDRFKK